MGAGGWSLFLSYGGEAGKCAGYIGYVSEGVRCIRLQLFGLHRPVRAKRWAWQSLAARGFCVCVPSF